MTRRKFRIKRSKRGENSIKPVVHIYQVAFHEEMLTSSKRVKRGRVLRYGCTIKQIHE